MPSPKVFKQNETPGRCYRFILWLHLSLGILGLCSGVPVSQFEEHKWSHENFITGAKISGFSFRKNSQAAKILQIAVVEAGAETSIRKLRQQFRHKKLRIQARLVVVGEKR